jgi:hypothetical protein
MKEFSQEFYNFLLSEKEDITKAIDENNKIYMDRPLTKNLVNNKFIIISVVVDNIIKKYKEICFRKDDE